MQQKDQPLMVPAASLEEGVADFTDADLMSFEINKSVIIFFNFLKNIEIVFLNRR